MKDYSNLPQVAPEYDLTDLLEAGCHFGHQKAKWNPRMAEFIYMEKDGVHIFDLEKTANQLQLAYNLVYDLATKGKTMIMVGTKKQAKSIIEEEAKANGAMYITSRWLGGLLTNWNQVKRSLKRMLNIGAGLKSGKYDGYTKFEKVQLEKEESRLDRFFGGIRELKSTPDFLFVVDSNREKNAVKEAKLMGVPVIALIDSNANPEDVDIAVPANDDALRSIKFIVSEVAKAYAEGKKASGAKNIGKTTAKSANQAGIKPVGKPVVASKAAAATVVAMPAPSVKKEETKVETPKIKKTKTVKKTSTKTESVEKKAASKKVVSKKTAKKVETKK